jgi:hypothetical protein
VYICEAPKTVICDYKKNGEYNGIAVLECTADLNATPCRFAKEVK